MFRVSFFCNDGKLAGILRDLAGRSYSLEVKPLAEAEREEPAAPVAANGKLTGASLVAQLPDKFTSDDLGKLLQAAGKDRRTATNYWSKVLIADKLVRRKGRGEFVKSARAS